MINRSSDRRRWDLHIHTKGTSKNDSYFSAVMSIYYCCPIKKSLKHKAIKILRYTYNVTQMCVLLVFFISSILTKES